MAQLATTNFLNYTDLTYSEIINQITNRLKQDERFNNFRESDIAQQVVEIFAGTTDFINYYIERRAEEQFFDTAQLRTSIIQIAKQLGYVVIRAVPAQTALQMTIKGPLPSGLLASQDQISLVKFASSFSHNGLPYILNKTYSYTLTQDDIDNGVGNSDFSKVIEVSVVGSPTLDIQGNIPTSATLPITMYQGEITSATFDVSTGGIFQEYSIDDTKFCNFYGDRDFGYNTDTGDTELTESVTQIGVANDLGETLLSDNLYEIDRRSLLTSETVLNSTSVSADIPQVCLIRTSMNEGVDIQFGDNKISKQPEVGQVIVVQYLATEGTNANVIGVTGDKLTTDNTFKASVSNIDLTSNLDFRLNKNITGGADMESAESIKINAPSLFYSLDRLVSKTDYITYLKSLTSPLNIRNAIVWGEQEEVKATGVTALNKLLNVVLYSVLGSMYYFPSTGEAIPRSLSATTTETNLTEVVLEGTDYSIISNGDLGYSEQVYFNLIVQGSESNCIGQTGVVEELGRVQSFGSDSNVNILNNDLDTRAQITIRHLYISPIIQDFYLSGDIYINRLSNQTETRIKINNAIYVYLNDNADFAVPIYRSKIVEIIESYPEVLYADIKFEPSPLLPDASLVTGELIDDPNIAQATGLTDAQKEEIVRIIKDNMEVYLGVTELGWASDSRYWRYGYGSRLTPPNAVNATIQDRYTNIEFDQTILNTPPWSGIYEGFLTQEKVSFTNSQFTERTFYYQFMSTLYNDIKTVGIGDYENTDDFKNLMVKLNNGLKKSIRNNMLDINQNIANYSLSMEVSKVEITANYLYKN